MDTAQLTKRENAERIRLEVSQLARRIAIPAIEEANRAFDDAWASGEILEIGYGRDEMRARILAGSRKLLAPHTSPEVQDADTNSR